MPGAEVRSLIAASPGYLAAMGTPRTIDDLTRHRLLHYSQLSTGNFWRLRGPSGEERQVRVGGRLTVNNGESLMKVLTSKQVCDLVAMGFSAQLAGETAVRLLTERTGGEGGLIAIDYLGQVGIAFNTKAMPFAYVMGNEVTVVRALPA